jgi:xanthine dehydrogenase accessory factor
VRDGDATPLSATEAVRLAREALEGGEPMASVAVIASRAADGSAAPPPGTRLAVWADRHRGTLGDARLDEQAAAFAREALAPGARVATREIAAGDVVVEVYAEPHHAPPELVIVGAGHIARPLCRIGALLGFRVTVLDDRPEFATRERFPEAEVVRRADFSDPFAGVPLTPRTHLVLVTRGHKYDFEALRDVLRRPQVPAYIGMVGSRRRTRAALEQLAREGVDAERIAAVRAPVGLDVHAETPEEIAVAIAAEMVLLRRGGSGRPLRETERVWERWVAPRGEPRNPDEAGP